MKRRGAAQEHPDDRPDRRRQDGDLAPPGEAGERRPSSRSRRRKFTEVGYVGRDVESIVRDLVEVGIGLVRETKRKDVRAKAHLEAEERVVEALVGANASPATREAFRRKLRAGELDDKEIEINVSAQPQMPSFELPGMPGASVGVMNLNEMFGKALGGQQKTIRTSVRDSYELLIDEESDKLLDDDQVVQEAIRAVENNGIVFHR